VSVPNLQRPLDLGAILDAALSIYRRHFVTVLASVGILVVPLALLEPVLGDVGSVVANALLAFIPTAVTANIVADVATGTQPTVGSVWNRVTPQVVPLILTAAMIIIPLVIGVVLVVVVAPFLIFFLFAPLIVVAIWLTQVAPVVAIENLRYMAAARRSKQLVSGSWWRVFGILLVVNVVGALASLALVLPFAGTSFDTTRPAAVGANAVAALLITPVTSLVAALLYFDLRLRKEGADIRRAIDELGHSPAPGE
jgi:hypothetical protein